MNSDNWIWLSRWTVAQMAGGGRRQRKERRGLGLSSPINAHGMLWIPESHISWPHGHLALQYLIQLYIPRSPLQAPLLHQPNIQALTASHVTLEYLFQNQVKAAHRAFADGNEAEAVAVALAGDAARLAAEEIARSYHQHFLQKMATFWDKVRHRFGRANLPRLDRLHQACQEAGEDRGRIVTAQMVWEIYLEAWERYMQVQQAITIDDDDSGDDNGGDENGGDENVQRDTPLSNGLPDEILRWMTIRRRQWMPPNNSWSAFLFSLLFDHPRPPTWHGNQFLQLYRNMRQTWAPLQAIAGSFDNQLRHHIGRYILVAFNSDRSKEVGTIHGRDTWYRSKPSFFCIQYWAPYFSPLLNNHTIPLASVYPNQYAYPEGLSGMSTPTTAFSARTFQLYEAAAYGTWQKVMVQTSALRLEEDPIIQRRIAILMGPQWGALAEGLGHLVPWDINDVADDHNLLRISVDEPRIPVALLASTVSRPTLLLPTCNTIFTLIDMINTLSGLPEDIYCDCNWI